MPPPRRRRITSLRWQLMLSLAVPIIALLIALGLVGFFGVTRLIETLVEQRDAELTRLAARQIASYWSDSLVLLTQVASTQEVRTADAAGTTVMLAQNTPLQRRFDQISVTDPDGMVTATFGGEVGESFGAIGLIDRTEQVRRPVRTPVITNVRGQAVVLVAIPYYGTDRRFGGCILGVWQLHGGRALRAALENVRVGETGYSYLVDSSGTVLYHPDAEMIGANASRHPAVAAFLAGEEGARSVTDSGRRTVAGFAAIPFHELSTSYFADETWAGWGMVITELWDDIMAPLESSVYLVVLLLVLTVVLPGAMSHTVTEQPVLIRGAVVCAFIDVAEAAGYRCEVWLNVASRKRMQTKGTQHRLPHREEHRIEYQVKLKRDVDPLDIDAISFALCHVAFARRLGFAHREDLPAVFRRQFNITEGGGYGVACETLMEGDINIPSLDSECFRNDDSAIEWLASKLEQIGVLEGGVE